MPNLTQNNKKKSDEEKERKTPHLFTVLFVYFIYRIRMTLGAALMGLYLSVTALMVYLSGAYIHTTTRTKPHDINTNQYGPAMLTYHTFVY